MLSSQTKDEVTYAAMQRLIAHGCSAAGEEGAGRSPRAVTRSWRHGAVTWYYLYCMRWWCFFLDDACALHTHTPPFPPSATPFLPTLVPPDCSHRRDACGQARSAHIPRGLLQEQGQVHPRCARIIVNRTGSAPQRPVVAPHAPLQLLPPAARPSLPETSPRPWRPSRRSLASGPRWRT